jgi:hypothetical protein
VAFVESIGLADATQGGIPFETALNFTVVERRAAIEIIKKIREEQDKNTKKK